MILVIIAFFIVLIVGYFLYKRYSLKLKRQVHIKSCRNLRSSWEQLLKRDFSFYSALSSDQKAKMLDGISILMKEKKWSSAASEGEQVLTCAYAVLPILERDSNYYAQKVFFEMTTDLKHWLRLHEKQFLAEFGKLNLKKFNESFVELSILYFENRQNLIKDEPELAKLLNKYYRFHQ